MYYNYHAWKILIEYSSSIYSSIYSVLTKIDYLEPDFRDYNTCKFVCGSRLNKQLNQQYHTFLDFSVTVRRNFLLP